MTLRWRPHTEQPFDDAAPFTALFAKRDDDEGDFYLLHGIKCWRRGEWCGEDEMKPLKIAEPYWWMPESEVLESLEEAWSLKE